VRKRIAIRNSNGETLNGILDLPANKAPQQYALFAHCFTCSSELAIARTISTELSQYGFGVLRFDFTGLGSSEGNFSDTNFSHNLTDLKAVHQYMASHFKPPSLIIGHSLGGAAVLASSLNLVGVKAIVTIGAPADPLHLRKMLPNKKDLSQNGSTTVSIGGRPFKIKKQFLEDLESHDLEKIIPRLRIPLLILHSPQDKVVEIENAAKIYQLARHPKSFISLDGADHLLSRKKDSRYAAQTIATWSNRYLNVNEDKEPLIPESAQVVAHLDLKDGFSTQISNGKHSLIADEPKRLGGEDLGFSPFELLQASLGACTNMTLKLYAQNKKWDLQEVYTHLSYMKEVKAGDIIIKRIELEGNLSLEQKNRLIEIAAKCPVNKSLLAGIKIETENYE